MVVTLEVIYHFEDESFHAITWTATDIQHTITEIKHEQVAQLSQKDRAAG